MSDIVKARTAIQRVREVLQDAHWTARDLFANQSSEATEKLLHELHQARMAVEDVRVELEASPALALR